MMLGYDMAWNEPGGGNRDPWSGGGRDQGPPDLDEVVRKLSDKFSALLGGRRGGGSSGGGGAAGSGGGGAGFAGIGLIVGVIAVIGCTATLMLAFLPLLALPGGAGQFIKSLPVTVLCTVDHDGCVQLVDDFLAARKQGDKPIPAEFGHDLNRPGAVGGPC